VPDDILQPRTIIGALADPALARVRLPVFENVPAILSESPPWQALNAVCKLLHDNARFAVPPAVDHCVLLDVVRVPFVEQYQFVADAHAGQSRASNAKTSTFDSLRAT